MAAEAEEEEEEEPLFLPQVKLLVEGGSHVT